MYLLSCGLVKYDADGEKTKTMKWTCRIYSSLAAAKVELQWFVHISLYFFEMKFQDLKNKILHTSLVDVNYELDWCNRGWGTVRAGIQRPCWQSGKFYLWVPPPKLCSVSSGIMIEWMDGRMEGKTLSSFDNTHFLFKSEYFDRDIWSTNQIQIVALHHASNLRVGWFPLPFHRKQHLRSVPENECLWLKWCCF